MFDIVEVNSHIYDISEEGHIWVEVHPEFFFLQKDSDIIDLSKPIEFEGFKVKQEDIVIDLESEQHLEYFKNTLKEITDGKSA